MLTLKNANENVWATPWQLNMSMSWFKLRDETQWALGRRLSEVGTVYVVRPSGCYCDRYVWVGDCLKWVLCMWWDPVGATVIGMLGYEIVWSGYCVCGETQWVLLWQVCLGMRLSGVGTVYVVRPSGCYCDRYVWVWDCLKWVLCTCCCVGMSRYIILPSYPEYPNQAQ